MGKQKEKPNYSLIYRSKSKGDWLDGEHKFTAPNDSTAVQIALSFIKRNNIRYESEYVYSNDDYCILTPLRLDRINYVLKEVEERTSIPLQGDTASRVNSGGLVELTELTNL